MWIKNIFSFYDYYKKAYVVYIALYFILIERSEVKLRLFKKKSTTKQKLRKLHIKLKFRLRKKYSVF